MVSTHYDNVVTDSMVDEKVPKLMIFEKGVELLNMAKMFRTFKVGITYNRDPLSYL